MCKIQNSFWDSFSMNQGSLNHFSHWHLFPNHLSCLCTSDNEGLSFQVLKQGEQQKENVISSTKNVWANKGHTYCEHRVHILKPFAKECFSGSLNTCNCMQNAMCICVCLCIYLGTGCTAFIELSKRMVKFKKHWKD